MLEAIKVDEARPEASALVVRPKLLPVKDVPENLSSSTARGWVYLEDYHKRGFRLDAPYRLAVPVGRLGPLMFMGHHDPDFSFADHYDMNLVVPCSISERNYAIVLSSISEISEFISTLFDETNSPEVDRMPDAWLKDSQGLDDEENTRRILTWYVSNTLTDHGMKGIVRSALERPTPVRSGISVDWLLILDYVQKQRMIGTIDVVAGRLAKTKEIGLEPALAASFGVVPFFEDQNTIFLLSRSLDDVEFDDYIAGHTDKKVVKVLSNPASIEAGNKIERVVSAGFDYDNQESHKEASFTVSDETFVDFDPYNGEVDRMSLVEWIMYQAADMSASDVHIDVFSGSTRVRFSIDGELETFLSLPRDYAESVSSCFKQLARIDAGSNAHSEGRFTYLANEKLIDIRLGFLRAGSNHNPTPKLVMRLLDRSRGVMDIADLRLDYEDLNLLKQAYSRRHGLILFSGGTGHGKSTTLAAILKSLNTSNRACYTLEDPIEINLDGVTQIMASAKAKEESVGGGLPFHNGLERLLRMDPDVIVVGEIRDAKTAEVTPKAALTGHLVLSTVHTNDAITVISRMLGFGVDPFDLAQSLALASSQVLVRKLCDCSKSSKLKPAQKEMFKRAGVEVNTDFISVPQGCSKCGFRGYRGRRVIMEFMPITSEIRDAIMEEKTPTEIRRVAVAQGYKTIFQKGLEMVLQGETSLEEILKHSTISSTSQSTSTDGDSEDSKAGDLVA